MKEWKLSIFNIVDKRIKFYYQNTNFLPPKPKFSFRHLKQGIQEFYRKYVLVPADKAANNDVVVCRLHYINTLKQELNGTTAYEETSIDEKSHRVQSLPRKRGRNSGLGVFSRRVAVVFDSFAAILKKIFVGELRKSFFKNKKRLCASVKTSSSGSTPISLITKCFADA